MLRLLWNRGTPLRGLHYGGGRPGTAVRRRVLQAGIALLVVFGLGVLGYWLIGGGEWRLRDCAYMVLITITTVGYSEVLPIQDNEAGRLFTMVLLVFGMGVSLYFLSALTAFIVEGDLREALWRRRMSNRLSKLKEHYLLCGAGQTGRQVAAELLRAGHELVVIERDQATMSRITDRHGDRIIALLGDATDDDVLRDAGVEQAAGIFATLENDQDNLYVALSARQLNPDLRIVSRGNDERSAVKLRQAGADSVISPARIGGRRMAHEMLRPHVVGFLDIAGRQPDQARNLCIEEVLVPEGSPLVGRKLAKSNIRQVSNALVLAVIKPNGGDTVYNPPPDFAFDEGMTIIVLGERDEVALLNQFVLGERRSIEIIRGRGKPAS